LALAWQVLATDGPFAETKEQIGGYAVYELKSMQEAMDWKSRGMRGRSSPDHSELDSR